jgi:hypothetical protein
MSGRLLLSRKFEYTSAHGNEQGPSTLHETAVEAKTLVAAYYGRNPRLSYWEGCSTGRRQGQSNLLLRLAHSSVDDGTQVTVVSHAKHYRPNG